MIIGWTTTSSHEDASLLARESVNKKLASCAQIDGPIRSFYIWNDEQKNDEEYRVTFKFLEQNESRLEKWLLENHPYEVAQWVTVKAHHISAAYLKWARENELHPEDIKVDLKKAVSLSREGNELLRKGRFSEAEKVFLEALEIDPNNSYILVGLGDLHREQRFYKKSLQYYEHVLKLDPDNIFALRGTGDSYRGLSMPERAIYHWNRYLEHNTEDYHVMTRVADALVKTNSFADSEKFYIKALSFKGNDKYALLGLGSLYYKIGEEDKALAQFDKLLALDDSYVAVLTMTGNIFRRRKEFELAANFYERAATKDPWNTFALFGLGDSLRGMKKYSEAVRWWSMIIEKEPKNQNMLTRIADALLAQEKIDKAYSYYERSLEIGYDPYALLGISRLERKRMNLDAAEAACRQLLNHSPEDPRFLEELANVYEDKGKPDKAREIRSKTN